MALLGPPELYRITTPIATAAVTPTASAPIIPSGDPLVDLMVENYNDTADQYEPFIGRTENYSLAFSHTGSRLLDFFFDVVPDSNSRVEPYTCAWDRDPLKALKLICNLRGVRGTGKSDKEGFYVGAFWLYRNHPKTLAANAAAFAEFGCLKDLLEILFRILDTTTSYNYYSPSKKVTSGKKATKEESAIEREEDRIKKAKRVVEKFNSDPNFKLFHESVSDLFAQKLRSDMKLLNSGDSSRISSAAKWCPSLDSSIDRSTLLCETIARKVFPLKEYPEYQGVEEAHYTYRVRDRLRKQVLVPLRKALQLPEVCIASNEWGSIPYERVSSDAMKICKWKFLKHDKERFEEYLARVNSGEAKIDSSALLPHDIIRGVKVQDPVSELQWKSMVAEMAKKGNLGNCLAVCDVSESMNGVPMEAAMALGILVSELSEGPWKGKLITFSNNPTLQIVKGASLRAKIQLMKRVGRESRDKKSYKEKGRESRDKKSYKEKGRERRDKKSYKEKRGKDLQKVFDALLRVAVQGKVKAEEMVKRVFVFSSMGFGDGEYRGSKSGRKTDYMAIEKKFKENGYGDCVPEMVFWKLNKCSSYFTPVLANQPGVALVSGYSKNPLTLFLEKGGIAAMDPKSVMEAAISGESYDQLVIID